MSLDLTFKHVCDFIKKDESTLIDAADKLLGLTIIFTPVVLGPAALPLLSLLTTKNELIKLGKSMFESITKKKEADYVALQKRMQVAYGLITYTAFFDALDKQLPADFRKRIGLLKEEKIFLAKAVCKQTECLPEKTTDEKEEVIGRDRFSMVSISFPHPTETLAQQEARLAKLYSQMSIGFKEFVQKLAFWEDADEKEQVSLLKLLDQVPQDATERFEAQYFELSRRYEDFAVWANLQEHKKTKQLIGSLSEYVQQYASLARSSRAAIDIGFAKLHQAVLNIPQTLKISQADEIVEGLTLHYKARVNEPIIEDKEEYQEDQPRLSFPKVNEAFIPQSYKVLRQTLKERRLEESFLQMLGMEDLRRRFSEPPLVVRL